jgi:hypothetical protein
MNEDALWRLPNRFYFGFLLCLESLQTATRKTGFRWPPVFYSQIALRWTTWLPRITSQPLSAHYPDVATRVMTSQRDQNVARGMNECLQTFMAYHHIEKEKLCCGTFRQAPAKSLLLGWPARLAPWPQLGTEPFACA